MRLTDEQHPFRGGKLLPILRGHVINGIPLVFIELKASHKRLDLAYDKNLKDYRDTIPQVFWYSAVVILSNGSKAKIGSMTAGFEHFSEWKKINSEGEVGIVSLDTMIRGACDKARLLDLVENFTIFNEARGEPQKLVAKNHQFLGVNNAIAAVTKIKDNQGKIGVSWCRLPTRVCQTAGGGNQRDSRLAGRAKLSLSESAGVRVHKSVS